MVYTEIFQRCKGLCYVCSHGYYVSRCKSCVIRYLIALIRVLGGGPRVVVSTAALHARVRGSSPGGLRPSTLPLGHGGSPQY